MPLIITARFIMRSPSPSQSMSGYFFSCHFCRANFLVWVLHRFSICHHFFPSKYLMYSSRDIKCPHTGHSIFNGSFPSGSVGCSPIVAAAASSSSSSRISSSIALNSSNVIGLGISPCRVYAIKCEARGGCGTWLISVPVASVLCLLLCRGFLLFEPLGLPRFFAVLVAGGALFVGGELVAGGELLAGWSRGGWDASTLSKCDGEQQQL